MPSMGTHTGLVLSILSCQLQLYSKYLKKHIASVSRAQKSTHRPTDPDQSLLSTTIVLTTLIENVAWT